MLALKLKNENEYGLYVSTTTCDDDSTTSNEDEDEYVDLCQF